ncbi:MAG: hypothetical protein J6S14_11985 [Clostridia bacterium]|nr:hypothetical protein [Clostridia bacterium]
MTLYELINNTTIQGNVDITCFVDGIETDSETFLHTDDLASVSFPEEWEDYEVKYIWASNDGYIHIEIYKEEDA